MSSATPSASSSCLILFLEIGPINLDLLGLQVFVSQIQLQVTASRGPGEILGNLLCPANGSPLSLASIDLAQLASALNTVFSSADESLLALPGNGAFTPFAAPLDLNQVFELLNTASTTTTTPLTSPHLVSTASCPILSLFIQNLDIFLLGLEVKLLQPLNVTITANPVGGILGQLLCDLTQLDVASVLPCSLLHSAQSVASNAASGGLNVPFASTSAVSGCGFTGGCNLLNLTLGPLFLNLLGLNVSLSEINLELNAFPTGGVLGSLLCPTIAGTTTATHAQSMMSQLIARGNPQSSGGASQQLALFSGPLPDSDPVCPLISLTINSLDLCLLGLELVLKPPSAGAPALQLNVTAVTGPNNLLGNLLCSATGNGPTSCLGGGP